MRAYERFLKYVTFETTSDERSDTVPSSDCQKILGAELAKELKEMGLFDAHLDDMGYVYATLPATNGCEAYDTIGFIAHMDTSPDVSGKNVNPRIVEYNGGDIILSDSEKISEEHFSNISNYIGQQLIVTDGTTLLGADDKAGVAEIYTAIEYFINNPEVEHGKIAICITPDEEIGCGADHFDVEKFGAKWAYTVDGGELPELEYENFNAASAKVTVNGVNIHPGAAKNKMKNSVLIANKFISLLPEEQTPAHTEGYEGFFHISDIEGNETKTTIFLLIRDHNIDKFNDKKTFLTDTVNYLNTIYGNGTLELEINDSYYNMKEMILPHMHIIDDAKAAMERVGLTPKIIPIRGGTDGARLSFMGLPCPNLATGGANAHSIHEFISVQAMDKMVEVIIEIAKR